MLGWKSIARASHSVRLNCLWTVRIRFSEYAERRRQQSLSWVRSMVEDHLLRSFYDNPAVKGHMPDVEARVAQGELAATQAALELLALYTKQSQG